MIRKKQIGIILCCAGIVLLSSGLYCIFHEPKDRQNIEESFLSLEKTIDDGPFAKEPTNYEKGKAFENYIIEKFDFSRKSLQLIPQDSTPGIKNCSDLLIQLTTKSEKYYFAVECSWRKHISATNIKWTKKETLSYMLSSADKYNAPLFLIMGNGGTPDSPETIYIIPINSNEQFILNSVTEYKCRNIQGKFYYDGINKTLTIK